MDGWGLGVGSWGAVLGWGLGTSGLGDFRGQLLQSDGQNLNCTIRSDRNQMVSDRILHQFGVALGVKNFHDAVFVKGHGASCKV